ncbi:MAG: EAL domain-containing protein [Vicinamibacterales bacterium]
MNLDPRTMVIVIITSTLLIGSGLLLIMRGYLGGVPGAQRWAVATLLQSAGWVLTGGLRGFVPEFVSSVLGPFLILVALTICLFVLHEFEGTPVRRLWKYGLLTANFGLGCYFTLVAPSIAARQLLLAVTAGPITLRSAWVLIAGPNRRVASHRFMAAVFAACGLVLVLRGAIFLVADPASVYPNEANPMNSVTLMAFYAVAVVLPFGFILMCNDRYVSQRHQAEAALSAAARVDALTQLPNRAMVTNRLSAVSARASRTPGTLFAVLFIDLNNFKYVNDSLGHEAGDQLLIETGQRLTGVIRSSDKLAQGGESIAGRFGGDEFVVVLDGLSKPDDASLVAERILDAMAAPFTLVGQRVAVPCSIGISVCEPNGRPVTTDDLLREADTAMYRAKLAGRANFVVFDESMHVEARRRLKLENDLRVALELDQIRAHYQPIIDLSTGTVVGFEALARWHHPEEGMIPPDAFIPVAEETGLIFEIGVRMMRQAVDTMERMNRLPGGHAIRMNVNVSRKELVDPRFFGRVCEVVSHMSVAPHRLRLEITETAVSGNATAPVSELLLALKELGVEILLDDFGAGLSSLSLLRSLPLDGIKIDRSFLDRSTGDVQAITILNAIISLGHNLGKTITVEGVSDPTQVATVMALEGDLAQGYLFGRPVPGQDAEALIGADFSASCAA